MTPWAEYEPLSGSYVSEVTPTSFDFEHSGPPLSSQTDVNVEIVCQQIHGER
jgi:hypothetical protein